MGTGRLLQKTDVLEDPTERDGDEVVEDVFMVPNTSPGTGD